MTEPGLPARAASPAGRDLAPVHEGLRALLAPYREQLHVGADGPGGMTLELPDHAGKPSGYVAGTRVGKRYVSYYLMGVYASPELLRDMSPGLGKRMQGKSCFNFATIDEKLFDELAALTARAIPRQIEIAEAIRASSGDSGRRRAAGQPAVGRPARE